MSDDFEPGFTDDVTNNRRETDCVRRLAAQIRKHCLRKGWGLDELAKRSGISSTTLHQIQSGKTRRPHLSTIGKIASALEIPPEEIDENGWGNFDPQYPPELAYRNHAVKRSNEFDRTTNVEVQDVREESPELFSGWTEDEWTELYSNFGTGGPLSSQGVVEVASGINRKRKTIEQLHVVLDTHLADIAVNIIETLYDEVCGGGRGGGGHFNGLSKSGQTSITVESNPLKRPTD